MLSLVLAVALLNAPASPDTAGWARKGGQGEIQFVLVATSRKAETRVYESAIKALCTPGEYCNLMFWADAKLLPTRLPMSDRQADAQVASYVNNPSTRFTELMFSCKLKINPNNCF